MSTEHLRLLVYVGFPVALAALVGCGEEQALPAQDAGPMDVTPRSVGVDHFGCPVVDPTPWAPEAEDYETFCGAGCRPFSADFVEGADSEPWFVACVSDDVRSSGVNDEGVLCITGPVDGRTYAASLTKAMKLAQLCWFSCAAEGPDPDSSFRHPDYCLE